MSELPLSPIAFVSVFLLTLILASVALGYIIDIKNQPRVIGQNDGIGTGLIYSRTANNILHFRSLLAGDFYTNVTTSTNEVIIGVNASFTSRRNYIVARDLNGDFEANIITATNLILDSYTSAGLVHNNSSGVLSSSLLVNADITNGTITDVKLATITTAGKVANSATTATAANTPSTIVLRDPSSQFAISTISFINTPSTSTCFQIQTTGDSFQRLITSANGDLLWGSGSVTGDTRISRTSANTLLIDAPIGTGNLQISGFEQIGTYTKIGGLSAPLNTSTGDVTMSRLVVGTDTLLSTANGEFTAFNGTDTSSGATNVTGNSFSTTFAPTSTSSGVLIGNRITARTGSNNAFTGNLIGASVGATLTGSGDIVSTVGILVASNLTGNQAGNGGLLTVTVGSSGGTGYAVNDVLTVAGGTGGTVIVLTLGPSNSVATVSIDHPGTGYTVSTDHATTVAPAGGTGALITILTRSSTSITATVGLRAQGMSANGTFVTPNIISSSAIQVITNDLGSGPVTNATQIGVDIQNLTGATTTNTGIIVRAFTGVPTTNLGISILGATGAATNNVGLRITQPTGASTLNQACQFSTQSTASSGGILFGSGADSPFLANMYRAANGRLRTDGEFQALHFLCVSSTPVVVAGPAVGLGSATILAGSTDAGQQVSITVTGGTINATLFTLTFATAYSTAATFVVYSAFNAAAAALLQTQTPFVSAATTTTFTFRSNAVAMTNGTYIYNFSVRA